MGTITRGYRPGDLQEPSANAKLKRMLADAMLDNVALKDLLGKKWRRPSHVGRPLRIRGRPLT
jgi:hypothetical protein